MRSDNLVAAGYFDGAIDEVRIWNVARTQGEIQSTMSQSLWLPTAGLVGRWAFDEPSGSTAAGSAGTGINGTIVGIAGTEWDRVACGSWITAVEPEPAVTELAFAIASGNPARGRVQFRFALPQAARVEREIHDVLGRRVASMADREFAPGVHRMTWDGTASGVRVPAGMYFARFRAGRWTSTKSVVVVR